MTGFVVCSDALLFVRDHHALALSAHEHFVFRQLEVAHGDELLVVARGVQRRFVYEVRKVGAREARRTASDHRDIHVFAERNLSRMDLQDAFASTNVRSGYDNASIESSWSQQRRIENVGTVS